MTAGLALFDTVIGVCGIAWSNRGLSGLQFPQATREQALGRLRQSHPGLQPAHPPPGIGCAILDVTRFLAGELETDLRAIRLDLDLVGAWEQRVYSAAREIPVGTTLTYGTVAERLGDPARARAVGQALGRNPWPIVVPCHRITAAGGGLGGFSAPGGRESKIRLLEMEGALAPEALPLFAPPLA